MDEEEIVVIESEETPEEIEIIEDGQEEIDVSEDVTLNVYDKNYVHKQSVPSDIWEIQHNLKKYPAVSVIDSSEREVFGDVEYIDLNNIKIIFSGEFSGKATLN